MNFASDFAFAFARHIRNFEYVGWRIAGTTTIYSNTGRYLHRYKAFAVGY
jgi:hypothetical protein